MAKIDQEFQLLCSKILSEGVEYENKKRGVKRLQIPSYTFRHSFADGFPAITNKKLYLKSIVGELLWFLRGDNDVKYLNENGIRIWNKDAYNWYKKNTVNPLSFEEFEKFGKGSVGQNYSVQWRNFNGDTDQIQELVDGMKKDIMSSRLKVNAWNPSELDQTALPPCHDGFQVIGVPLSREQMIGVARERGMNISKSMPVSELKFLNIPEFGFELHWNQRSVDTFLGLPFNIASYASLAEFLEVKTGYKALAIEGALKCVHFYDNQYDAVKELLKRNPDTHPNCKLSIIQRGDYLNINLDDVLNELSISDFKLVGYTSDEEIKVEMLAPKEL